MSLNPDNILLFDGVCNLCNGAVNFIIDRDKKGVIKFASLQSDFGQALLQKYHLPTQTFNSLVFVHKNNAYQKSTGVLLLAKELGGIYQLAVLLLIVPRFIRDFVYDQVAQNRYKWFGKSDSCRMPTPELKARFLG
jgi:predicted DCC family thiol-disulfide oxidoreductase YuxK